MKITSWLLGALLMINGAAFAQTTAPAWVEAGRGFVNSNQNDKAIEAFNKALELEPNNIAALVARGNYYYWQGNDEKKALADVESAAKIGSKDVEELNSLAILFDTLSLHEKALEWYDKAIQIDPKAQWPLENRARTLEDLARDKNNDKALLQKALTAYVQLTEAVPSTEIGWLRRGYIESDLGLHEKAVASFARTIILQKAPDAIGYTWRGRSYLALKKYEEALADFRKAQEFGGASSELYADAARAYEGKKDDVNALKCWNFAVSSPDSGPEPLKGRAEFYRRTGKMDLAIADEKKAAELEAVAP